MTKYTFINNRDVIDEPSILTITRSLISIKHASGTDVKGIPEGSPLIIQIGNINSFNPSTVEPIDVPTTPDNPVDPGTDPTPQGGGDDPGTDPGTGGDDPVNPDAGNPVININVNITNNTSSTVTLDGRLRFVLGNPDHNGNYFGGYTGTYIRTDSIWFNNGSVTLAPGETRTYYNLSWQDADTGLGLGETSPLDADHFPIYDDEGGIAYAGNVLMYTGGRSDVTLCENLNSSTIFQEGGTYDIIIKQA